MADIITVTVDNLPALSGLAGDEQIAVYKGGRLGRMPQSALRGTRTFSDASAPPAQPSVIALMSPLLGDRWRNTSTGDEWKVTSLSPFTWTPDGNVRGPAGTNISVPAPGPPGATTVDGLTDATPIGKAVAKATARAFSDQNGSAVVTDTYIAVASLTAPRTITLPAASAFPRGKTLYVADESGACSSALIITIAAAGSDTIAGQSSVTMQSAYQKLAFHSNGSNLWTFA